MTPRSPIIKRNFKMHKSFIYSQHPLTYLRDQRFRLPWSLFKNQSNPHSHRRTIAVGLKDHRFSFLNIQITYTPSYKSQRSPPQTSKWGPTYVILSFFHFLVDSLKQTLLLRYDHKRARVYRFSNTYKKPRPLHFHALLLSTKLCNLFYWIYIYLQEGYRV